MLQLSRRTSEEVYQLALGISGLVLLIWGFFIAHSFVQVAIEILLLVLYRVHVARLVKKTRALAVANVDY
jgi:hypothetical protein